MEHRLNQKDCKTKELKMPQKGIPFRLTRQRQFSSLLNLERSEIIVNTNMVIQIWKISSTLQLGMENLEGSMWRSGNVWNEKQWRDVRCVDFSMGTTWEVSLHILTLSDVSSLTPGYVLKELFKHPVCLFWINEARNQMNPKKEDTEKKEGIKTSIYALIKYSNFWDSQRI